MNETSDARAGGLSFKQWLRLQADRDDSIGDLARVVGDDPGVPTGQRNILERWHIYLDQAGVPFEAFSALDRAWGEYVSDLRSGRYRR